jgi:hypothetical protein
MNFEFFEQIPVLFPAEFFSLSCSIEHSKFSAAQPTSRMMRKSYLLPDTSELFGEEKFSDVALCWDQEGICLEAYVDKPFEEAYYPFFSKGDALEFFFDTRDLKTAGFATRFCHHFVILPQSVQEIQAIEITHFRTEDTHPLCDPKDLFVHTTFEKNAYAVRVLIPAHCLHGYDPKSCDKMGFTYRIHRPLGRPQHFSASSDHFSLEQSPRLWATLNLSTA